jgi:zinc/manganese transport system permease protein
MFTGVMANTWIAASIVAVIAGMTGYFAVLRGQTFAAHAIPNGAFAGAAGASLLGINVIVGLAVVAVAGALGIGALSSGTRDGKARHDVVTALTLVLMLGLGALFVSVSTEYAQETYALLFGEVFGVSSAEVAPIAGLGIAAAVAIGVAFRPLMLTSALPEVADARGLSSRKMELYFLLVVAITTSMTVPVVGALLMFSLMIGPAAAARSVTARPGVALALSVAIALVITWLSIALAYRTNWPLGFFVGIGGAIFYLIGLASRLLSARGDDPRSPPMRARWQRPPSYRARGRGKARPRGSRRNPFWIKRRYGEPAEDRNQPLPPAARGQPGRLVAVVGRSVRRGATAGRASHAVGRVRGLPLVPRHGARVVRGPGDRRPRQ